MQPLPQGQRSSYVCPALILCAALAASLAVDFIYFPRDILLPDEARFLESARNLAASEQFVSNGAYAWEMPGTALFQAPFVAALGPKPLLAIRVTQAALLLVQAALSGWIAFQLFENPRSAVIAAAITAFYPFFVFYQGLMLSEAIFNVLLVAAVAALMLWHKRGMAMDRVFALACLLFAAATYVKATLTILPPFLFAAMVLAAGAGVTRSVRILALAGILYCASLTPWWFRNYVALDHFVPFTTSAGQNLYLGNNPINKHAGVDWSSDVEPDKVARIMSLPNEILRQQEFSAAAIDYIKQDPAAFVARAGRKFARFWNIVPNAAEFRAPLFVIVSAASFGPILVLAVICAIFSYAPQRLLMPFYLLFAFFTLMHAITIASLRYRLPLEPLLIIMASDSLRRFIDFGIDAFSLNKPRPRLPAA